jgi:hypothetical protein
MMLDWLVAGKVVPLNPVHAVQSRLHSASKGRNADAVL